MSVVRHAADFVDEDFFVLAEARDVRPKLGFVGDNRTPVFGAENDVNQGLDVGVGQCVVLQGGYCNGNVPRLLTPARAKPARAGDPERRSGILDGSYGYVAF